MHVLSVKNKHNNYKLEVTFTRLLCNLKRRKIDSAKKYKQGDLCKITINTVPVSSNFLG